MQHWIVESDLVQFEDEVRAVAEDVQAVGFSLFGNFTGDPLRRFFDYIVDRTFQEVLVKGLDSLTSRMFVRSELLVDFGERLRLLNTGLFTFQYVEETKNLFIVEVVVKHSKIVSPVSILIPAYNSGIVDLRECIESAIAAIQSTENSDASEILVVDDFSANSDEIYALVASLQTSFPRIKYHRMSANQGVSTVRNFGTLTAVNDIIVYLDHDDKIEPQHINLIVNDIVTRGADLVATNMRFPDGHIFCAHLSAHRGFLIENGFGSGIAINRASPRVRNLMATGELFNTENRTHFEDWELNSVAKLLGWRISIVPYASYFYTFLPSGRDSTNLSLKRHSTLITPLNAINRVRKVSPDNAYYSLREYTESLIGNIIQLESSGSHLETMRLRDIEVILRREIEILRRDVELTQQRAEQETVSSREYSQQLSERLVQSEIRLAATQNRNVLASAKVHFKQVESLIGKIPGVSLLYRFSLKPLIYGGYRSVRAVFRVFFSTIKPRNHAI